jgi:hypothetical protein
MLDGVTRFDLMGDMNSCDQSPIHDDGYRCSTYGNGYFTFTVDSYSDFIHKIVPLFSNNRGDLYVWRGMRLPEWDLQSSMSRELAKMPYSKNEWKVRATRETVNHLRCYLEMLRGLDQLSEAGGKLYSLLEKHTHEKNFSFKDVLFDYDIRDYRRLIYDMFALGQHHDMLTPFLDWSRSPLIALPSS